MKTTLIRTGTGHAYPKCFTFKFTIACPNKQCYREPVHVRCNCHRLSCPECFRSEANAQARKVSARLIGLTNTYVKNRVPAGKPKHVVVSRSYLLPESKKNDKKACAKYVNACVNILKKYAKDRWTGGVVIFHPWRRKGLNRETSQWESVEDDDHEGKYIRYKWIWSPHIHAVCYGFFFKNGKEIEKETGFFFTRIQDKEGKDRNIRETVHYLLTHSGIWINEDDKQFCQAYSYFGKYSTNAGAGVKIGKRLEQQQCHCQTNLVKWMPDEIGADEPTMEYSHGQLKALDRNYLDQWKDHEHHGTTEDYTIPKILYEYHLNDKSLPERYSQEEDEDPDQDNVRVLHSKAG